MESQLKKNEKEVENLESKLKETKNILSGTNLTISTTKMNTGNVPSSLLDEQKIQTVEVENLTSKLTIAREESQRLKSEIETLKLNPMVSMEAQNLKAKIDETERSLEETKKDASDLAQEIQKVNQLNLSNITTSINNFGKNIEKHLVGKKGLSSGIDSIGSKITKLSKKITRLALTAMVFRLIRQSLTGLSNGFMSLLKSNDDFSNSLNQIKANLMTAFAPIYSAVLPAINTLMNALSKITGTIATFISSLFGKTASQAKKNAKELYNQANATKAISEAQEGLAGFDKLEVNPANNENSSGGGSGSTGVNFEGEIQVNEKLLDFLNKIKELIGDGKWFDVGATLANSLNSVLNKLDVKGFMAKGGELAYNLCQGINGFVNTFDWSTLGEKISDFIKGLGNIILTGLITIDWQGIGKAVGDFLLSIDWWNILVVIPLSIISALIDAIIELFSGLLISLCEHLDEWIPQLWEAIKGIPNWIVENILKPVGEAVGETLKSLLNATSNLWENIKDGSKSLWDSICEVWNTVATWFNDTVIKPVGDFFKNMWDSVKNGAKNAWEGIKNVFGKVAQFFKDIFSTAWSKVKEVFSNGGQIFNGIKEGILNAFKNVVNALIRGINNVVSMPFNGLNGILNTLQGINFLGISPFSWLSWRAPIPQLPYLATGAVIPPNAKFTAVLGDQKHGKNLEAPESLIRQIVREESGEKEVILNATFIMQCETEEIGRASLNGIRLLENLEGAPYFVR